MDLLSSNVAQPSLQLYTLDPLTIVSSLFVFGVAVLWWYIGAGSIARQTLLPPTLRSFLVWWSISLCVLMLTLLMAINSWLQFGAYLLAAAVGAVICVAAITTAAWVSTIDVWARARTVVRAIRSRVAASIRAANQPGDSLPQGATGSEGQAAPASRQLVPELSAPDGQPIVELSIPDAKSYKFIQLSSQKSHLTYKGLDKENNPVEFIAAIPEDRIAITTNRFVQQHIRPRIQQLASNHGLKVRSTYWCYDDERNTRHLVFDVLELNQGEHTVLVNDDTSDADFQHRDEHTTQEAHQAIGDRDDAARQVGEPHTSEEVLR
jgi:hypothetical protein